MSSHFFLDMTHWIAKTEIGFDPNNNILKGYIEKCLSFVFKPLIKF